MRAVIVYESMFGATRQVAEAIAEGLGGPDVATVVPVRDATADLIASSDLLVVGGPTHAHGMSRARTRQTAAEMADKPDKHLHLEAGATGPGLREWLARLGRLQGPAAAFDTRACSPALLTGRASRKIGTLLQRRGAWLIGKPHSFLIARDELAPGQLDAARAWGTALAAAVHSNRAAA